jgi:hypothetical protein
MNMNDVMRSCLWAAAIILPAALAGLAVIYYAVSRSDMMSSVFLLAGAIRLLLSLVGSVIILRFAAVPVIWFVAWLGLLYFVMLAVEVYITIQMMSKHKKQGIVAFDIHRNVS